MAATCQQTILLVLDLHLNMFVYWQIAKLEATVNDLKSELSTSELMARQATDKVRLFWFDWFYLQWSQQVYKQIELLLLCPSRERSIAISLSVCLSVHKHISGTAGPILSRILLADCLWLWLGPHPAALRYVMYFQFYGWRHVFAVVGCMYRVAKYRAPSSVARPRWSLMSMNALLLPLPLR